MAEDHKNSGRDPSQLIVGTFLLLSVGVLLSEILDYIETGTWMNMSVMDFLDLLTENRETADARSQLLGLRSLFGILPILPLFLMSGLLAMLWTLFKGHRRSHDPR